MRRCGLLGEHLGHSYSPFLHQQFGDYSYDLFEVKPEKLGDFLEAGDFHGLNVTIPYKTAVLPFCAALSDRARALGSVNTLLRRADGTLFGENTDVLGFEELLRQSRLALCGEKVLVLGSGGASRSVCHVLSEQGAREVVVISRHGEDHYGNLERHQDAGIIVNTTPVGMYPENGAAPLTLAQFPHGKGVLDLIYNPRRTALMREAEALGIPSFGGLSMLVYQARAAAELFSGHKIEDCAARAALSALRARMENVILVGMPGCGKSTVGAALAEKLGRDFVDADRAIEQAADRTIPEIFAQEGESGFRARESAVLRALGACSGLVLATGGGCVTRAENYALLHQNGTIVHLERECAALEREGRPLSEGADLAALYAKRLPLYQRFADLSVQNDAQAEIVAGRIWEAVYEAFGD